MKKRRSDLGVLRPYQVKNDISGRRFGFLVATTIHSVGKRGAVWNVKCDCGRRHKVSRTSLISGSTTSCGCRGGKHSPYGMTPMERILANITAEPNSGCWLWLKTCNQKGYGTIGVPGRRNAFVHRLTYEHFVGPIPDGLVLDHKCCVTSCVNPQHLRPMTIYENAALGDPNRWIRERRTCPSGHTYTEETTIRTPSGGRRCRVCADGARLRKNAKERFRRALAKDAKLRSEPG